jgi:hypothetical protein
LHQESWRPFILRRFFGSQTKNLANANTGILFRIFALRYAQLAKNNGAVMASEGEASHEIT